MEKAYKYRIYPNKTQKTLIAKTFGCVRFVYNYYLDKRIKQYEKDKTTINYNDCSKDMTSLKKELVWLKEVDSVSLQSSLKDLDIAYQNFFREIKKGNSNQGFPKFKSKKNNRHSYKTKQRINIENNKIKLPKLGHIKTRNKHFPQGRILNATISQEPSGKYYVSICFTDVIHNQLPKTSKQIGIDLGLTHFAIISDGTKIDNPRYFRKSEKKLAELQRKLSRKQISGKNRNKARIKVARQYEKIKNQRNDFLHKLSTKLIRENDLICLETLKVKNMVKNHKIAKSISDASWSEFVRQLEYKAEWHGKQISKIDTYFPSSQLCFDCGYKNELVKDKTVREWICPNCKTWHDRDINASKNILREGIVGTTRLA